MMLVMVLPKIYDCALSTARERGIQLFSILSLAILTHNLFLRSIFNSSAFVIHLHYSIERMEASGVFHYLLIGQYLIDFISFLCYIPHMLLVIYIWRYL